MHLFSSVSRHFRQSLKHLEFLLPPSGSSWRGCALRCCCCCWKVCITRHILTKLSLDNVASIEGRTVWWNVVVVFTERRGRKKGLNGHGCCGLSSPPPPCCWAAGRGSVCGEATWSFIRWTLRTSLTPTTNTGSNWITCGPHFNRRIIFVCIGYRTPSPSPCLTKTTIGQCCQATKLVLWPGPWWKDPKGKEMFHSR